MTRQLWTIALSAALGVCAPAAAQVTDNFEVDSSASYTVVDESNAASGDGTPDSTVDFAFDYIAAGIPLAPNSAPGDLGGLRLAVNETDTDAGAADHVAVFNNAAMTGFYRLDVDMYMGVEAGAGGSTEFAHVGVAGSTNDFTSIFTPIVDNGYFISITGEGGSSSDYRMSAPGEPAIASGDARYLNTGSTTQSTGDTYQGLFPSTDYPGSPGNVWTTLSITVGPEFVAYWLDGTVVMRTPTTITDGQVSLGYTDAFSSVGPHFVIYDNLSVTSIPEPTAAFLALTGLAGFAGRRRV